MNRKMITLKKSLFAALFVFAALITSVFANPIQINQVNVENSNGDYKVVVSLENLNTATDACEQLSFEIVETGKSNDVTFCESNFTSGTQDWYLQDVIDSASFASLVKGDSYTLSITSSAGTVTDSFIYGTAVDSGEGLPLVIESVKVNGATMSKGSTIKVNTGQTLTVDLTFTALQTFDDARFRVEIEGYEHDTDSIRDSTEIFMENEVGVTDTKSMSIIIPSDMKSGERYYLRISGANALSGLSYIEYELYVDTQRHRIDIIDLVMTPSSGAQPGQNIVASVRMKNRGQKSQDSINVIVEVPKMPSMTQNSWLSNLDPNEVATSDDMLLTVPEDAKAGDYQILVKLEYNDGYTETVSSETITILSPKVVEDKNLYVSFKDNVDLTASEEKTFEVVIGNPNDESKPISIVPVDDVWADVEVSPTFDMIGAGDSSVFTIKVTPKSSIEGEKDLSLVVKEGSSTISELTVHTYVEGQQKINWVNVALAVLLVIAIIILLSLVITIAKRKNERSEEDDYSSTEEYY